MRERPDLQQRAGAVWEGRGYWLDAAEPTLCLSPTLHKLLTEATPAEEHALAKAFGAALLPDMALTSKPN